MRFAADVIQIRLVYVVKVYKVRTKIQAPVENEVQW